MEHTWQSLAQQALDVQNACNLSGVLMGAHKAVCEVRRLLEAQGWDSSTDAVNTHPCSVLWADKIAHLAGTQSLNSRRVEHAYNWAREMGAVYR